MDLLGIPNLGGEVWCRGMNWLHLPIRDSGTPSAAFEADWPMHSRRSRGLLDSGQNILVHCRGGLGRAGMISARLLVECGVKPDAAKTRVRARGLGRSRRGNRKRGQDRSNRPKPAEPEPKRNSVPKAHDSLGFLGVFG